MTTPMAKNMLNLKSTLAVLRQERTAPVLPQRQPVEHVHKSLYTIVPMHRHDTKKPPREDTAFEPS
jgi:hypothetical protein